MAVLVRVVHSWCLLVGLHFYGFRPKSGFSFLSLGLAGCSHWMAFPLSFLLVSTGVALRCGFFLIFPVTGDAGFALLFLSLPFEISPIFSLLLGP